MKASENDIVTMLDELGLTTSAICLKEILSGKEFANYSAQQLLREVITPQHTEIMNKRYTTNLKFSKLIDKSAEIEKLKTGNGRTYNDETVQQVLTYKFVEDGFNIGIYGKTGAGKSYFMSALCNEACRQNYRCMYLDYSDLLDELLVLSRNEKTYEKYRKKIKYYSRIRLLLIDDFAISRYPEDGIKILYHLLKSRADLGNSTAFTCQYSPDEWGTQLSDESDCYGKLDGIRRRLTNGYTICIEKA